MDAFFLRGIVAGRLVIRAAIVPDHDVADLPLVGVLGAMRRHAAGEFLDEGIAVIRAHALDVRNLHRVEVEHPASGFAAELSAAAVVLMASLLGIPVSSTHILIGAVLGVGLVNRQTNWALMKPIALAWVITLPAAAMLSAVFLLLFRLL